MKHHAIPFSLLLSLAISGCLADMEEFEAYMLPCEEGKTICSEDGKQLLRCVNHEFVFAQFCPTQCSEGACDCEEGETICSEDRKHLVICHDHQYVYQYCPYLCSNGACNTIPEDPKPTTKCTDEETKCAGAKGNKLYRCQSGKWEHVATCEDACENGACIDPPPTNCSDNEFRCAGDTLYKYDCQDGEWKLQKRCENACENGSCVGEPEIDPQTCSKQGQVMCNGSCIDPMNSKEYCGADTSCKGYHSCSVDEVCQSGVCKPNVCPANQHSYQGNCEPDSVTNCGKHDYRCALEIDGWQNGTCSQGQCLATECTGSYHLFNKSCEQDSTSNCGAHGAQCYDANATNIICLNGSCQVTACETGYHVNNNACEADSTISCNDNECFYNNSCINQNDHCGKQCLNCNTFTPHATAGTCNNYGTCQVTACETGYHVNNNACEADSTQTMISVWEGNSVSFPIQDRVGTIIIDWGDGKSDTITFGESNYIVHQYSKQGTYTISVSGTINNWSCDAGTDTSLCSGLISIQSYGHTTFGENAFFKAENLVSLPTNITPKFYTNKMVGTFQGAKNFNQDISFWDTSNVTDMSHMLNNATAFNQPLNEWDTSNVTNMSGMFRDAKAFNQPLNNWNTSNVKSMTSMFDGAKAFNQPLNTWDTSNVTDMSEMFHKATAFNQPLNNWDTSNVTDMSKMFYAAKLFNQPLDNWNTSRVTDMKFMFTSTTAFNQPLDNWDISDVTEMSYIFTGSGLDKSNYCALFKGAYSAYWTKWKHDLGKSYNCN